jgi:hypothetical protein
MYLTSIISPNEYYKVSYYDHNKLPRLYDLFLDYKTPDIPNL